MSRFREGELLHEFVEGASQQLSRFTAEPVFVSRSWDDSPYVLGFRRPARLSRDLFLVLRHYVVMTGGAIETAGYHYGLERADGREILVYHWHPDAAPGDPHLHLEAGAEVGRRELVDLHIPTGPVGWSDLLWLLRQITLR